MRTSSLILSLLALFAILSSIHANVIDLTASNFDEKVLKSDGLWVVAFVAPWCGHCQRLKPEYVKAAEALGGVVNVGTVNCDDEKELAGRYGIRGFPTIKVFKAGKENKGSPEDYQGARSAKAIVDYLMYIFNGLPDPVQSISDEAALNSFAAADKTVALLVTSKPTTPALFKSIGIELGSKLKLGFVQDSKKDLTALLGVEKAPAVLVIKAGEGSIADRKVVFGGPLKKQELMTFFTKNAASASSASSSSSAGGSSSSTASSSAPTPAAEEVLAYKDPEEINEQSQIDELCKQTCVIGVVRSPSDKDLIFNYAFQYRRQLKFGYIDPSKHASFLEQLGSAEGEGVELVVLRMGKKKFAVSRVAEANAPMFFESVVYGGIRFKQLPSGFSLSKKNKDEL